MDMASTPSLRPPIARQHSRVPGGFDTDSDLSPIKPDFDLDDIISHITPTHSQSSFSENPTPKGDNRFFPAAIEDGKSRLASDISIMSVDEMEMRRRLLDLDSSFLPETSPATRPGQIGTDDTFVFGATHHDVDVTASPETYHGSEKQMRHEAKEHITSPSSPITPPDMYQTPYPRHGADPSDERRSGARPDRDYQTRSSSEIILSSPTASAAARTVSRVVSQASLGGYETADEQGQSQTINADGKTGDTELTPRKPFKLSTSSSRAGSPTPTRPTIYQDAEEATNGDIDDMDLNPMRSRKRPKFLSSRRASQRSSYSSYTTTSTEGASEVTIGADYALQSGGAIPFGGSLNGRPTMGLSRSTSLGSMASGISGLSDGEEKTKVVNDCGLEGNLHTLDEEDDVAVKGDILNDGSRDRPPPQTPRATNRSLNTPTDSVVAQHVREVQVPATIAREYRYKNRPPSPEKRNGLTTPLNGRSSKNLTLKEQGSTIDRLQKENWDLKLKIHHLDQALNKRSDEGVKAMVSENVDLRLAQVKFKKEIHELKRSIRELERKLKEPENDSAVSARNRDIAENAAANFEDMQDMETEMSFLRERVTTYEVEIEKMRHEGSAREGEKRQLAEFVKSIGQRRNAENDIGAREEMDMWKDLLEAETARREQADEDNRKLREEILRLRSDASSTTTNNHATNVYHITKRHPVSTTGSQINGFDHELDRSGATSAASSTLVEQLRHENAELRREVGAQTSMLTSRNREKERLYQEIEDLKLGTRRGDGTRSIAGDSILERSASRAHGRSASRVSDTTRVTQLTDPEREDYEFRIGELRDQNSEQKLKNQELTRQIGELLDELEQFDIMKVDFQNLRQDYEEELDLANEDLQTMQSERDEVLRLREDIELQLEHFKGEAQTRIDELEEELDGRVQEMQSLENQISNRTEECDALRKEVRSMSERLNRVEDDSQDKIKRIQDLLLENEDMNRELENLEKTLFEANSKNERLNVQQESSETKIAFLHEEQDSDKIKIGDLENAIQAAQASIDSEKERARELESRLVEERHQREVTGSKEKQEVQKMINDLNRETSSSKDESRKLKKSLQSREVEAATWKERLSELENSLREVLSDSNGTRSSFLTSIIKMQKELDSTASELGIVKSNLDDKERLLSNRDALLESHGLESKKLSELLERERQGRRAEQAQHEQWQKTHQHTSRTVTQKDVRITELETAKQSDRKRITVLEGQFREQLGERNNLLLALWSRLSAMCGSDWQAHNNLVNGHLPTIEVVSSMLPGFSKNLFLAVKSIESLIGSFKGRVQGIERKLWQDYQTLENNLESKTKRLDRIENTVQSSLVSGSFSAAPEIAKLRGENRLLKADLGVLQKQEMHARASRSDQRNSASGSRSSIDPNTRAALSATLMRHHSSSAVEALERGGGDNSGAVIQSMPIEPSQTRWVLRLKELETRLKAEREGRLLDRSGARKRLEEREKQNKHLKNQLNREMDRRNA